MSANGHAIQKVEHVAAAPVRFSEEQRKIILDTCCGGASSQEAAVLIELAQQRGLNPLLGDCYFVQRYDTQRGRMTWAVQASIDSFRMKADETGLYDGQDEPEFEYDAAGHVKLARVKVYRKDWSRPAVGVARYDEYVQTKKEGGPTKFWKTMPHNQLAKCAESLAMRKAFPRQLAKIYTAEEMAQADNERTPERVPSAVQVTSDGEVIEESRPQLAKASPIPSGGDLEAKILKTYLDAIVAAQSPEDLTKVAKAIKSELDRGNIGLESFAKLKELGKLRKGELQIAADLKAKKELDDMGDMAPGWGNTGDISKDVERQPGED